MKTVSLATLIASLFVSQMAVAFVAPQALSANLTKWNLDQQLSYANDIESASVSVDLITKKINLTLNKKFYCPPEVYCAQSMPAPIIISLPLVTIQSGICGTTVYIAEENKLPVDGIRQMLKVHDNREFSSHCLAIQSFPETAVVYETERYGRMNRQIFKTHSTLAGEALN
ncbi:MAG: hypothetical protein SGJ18_09950 [Pseudomonadota bacterium]|nr:hypothetical protein [Pseudomonadota bacterium]